MDQLSILSENLPFLGSAYNMQTFMGFIFIISLVDMALKGWGMWRAGRMGKKVWFIAILIVNSIGILPIIFLLLTKGEYKKFLDAHAPAASAL